MTDNTLYFREGSDHEIIKVTIADYDIEFVRFHPKSNASYYEEYIGEDYQVAAINSGKAEIVKGRMTW